MLDTKQVVAAAEPYVRMLIRVPEAYLLIRPYETTRPGLLVMDADGRRVDSLALQNQKPAAVAKWLAEARTKAPAERFVVDVVKGDAEALRSAVEGKLLGKRLIVTAKKGELSPSGLQKAAEMHGVEVKWLEPVPVRAAGPTEDLAKVAGVRELEGGRAWVSALLLHPEPLAAAGELDIEMRLFDLPGVSHGPPGARVAMAPGTVPGVLSVFPDIFSDEQTVVARKGEVDWDAVAAAFRKAGVEAR